MAKDGEERLYTQAEVDGLIEAATRPLLELVAGLQARVEQLEAQIARMRKDSSNSSKPPSSDVVKPKPKKRRGKRKRGGQKGHPRHTRTPFTPDQVDRSWDYELQDTTGLQPLDGPDGWRVVQQVELPEKLFEVTEHRARRYRCVRTGRIVTAPLPQEVTKAGLVGPRLSTLICYLKGACHGSYRTVTTFLDEVIGVELSVGLVTKAVAKMTAALDGCYGEMRDALPKQDVLGLDETGLRHAGEGHWVWAAHAPGPDGMTCFTIHASRGSCVLHEILGREYRGIILCDFFSAYRKFLTDAQWATMQFCWAHLIRDIKFMTDLPDKVTANFGRRVLEAVGRMFALIHRRAELTEAGYRRQLRRVRDKIVKLIRGAPNRNEPRNLKKRFAEHGDSYFTFMDHHGVDPTNNRTEQKIRFVVIDRKVTQGTKGRIGQMWCERIWSTIATARQRGRPLFQFLLDTFNAHIRGKLTPSLIYA